MFSVLKQLTANVFSRHKCNALSITAFQLIDHDPEYIDANHDVNTTVKVCGNPAVPCGWRPFPTVIFYLLGEGIYDFRQEQFGEWQVEPQ